MHAGEYQNNIAVLTADIYMNFWGSAIVSDIIYFVRKTRPFSFTWEAPQRKIKLSSQKSHDLHKDKNTTSVYNIMHLKLFGIFHKPKMCKIYLLKINGVQVKTATLNPLLWCKDLFYWTFLLKTFMHRVNMNSDTCVKERWSLWSL